MAKTTVVEFTVEGHLEFPCDMLRYDACYPCDTESAIAISESHRPTARVQRRENNKPFRVSLRTRVGGEPTGGRWSSFGWHIVTGSVRRY